MAAPIGLECVNFEPVTQGYGAVSLRPDARLCPINYRWYDSTTGIEAQVQYVAGVKAWVTIDGEIWRSLTGVYSGLLGSTAAAGIWRLRTDGAAPALSTSALQIAEAVLPVDPAQYAVTGKTAQVRLVAWVVTTSVTAPGITFTFRLYPITAVAAFVPTVGTGVGDAVVTTPAVNTQTVVYGAPITMPAANVQFIGVLTSGTNAAVTVQMRATLQIRVI